ncbi:MAG: ATP-binding cassette domain-containing protein, partial [Firmicutes bacterium]|nr:ATP-binding cassette domain-containing protein [Bacillota bacterium]
AKPPLCYISTVLAEEGYPELASCLTEEDLLNMLKKYARNREKNLAHSTTISENALLQETGAITTVARDSTCAAIAKESATNCCDPSLLSAQMAIIETRNLHYTYLASGLQPVKALRGLDITINSGEIVALIGHSGSGKSTLAHLLTGLIAPSMGEVTVGGKSHSALAKGAIFRRVGLVFQYPEQQLFAETVAEEVAFGAKNFGILEQKLPIVTENALQEVGLPAQDFLKRSPFTLSGGQKRRLSIACVLAMKTDVLILDEPTAGLDECGRQWMIELARRLQQQGKTIIWISHNMEEVAELASRIIVLHQGRVVKDGLPQEVFSAAAELSALGLDIPAAAKLVRQAKNMGLPLPGRAITVAEACQELLDFLNLAAKQPSGW